MRIEIWGHISLYCIVVFLLTISNVSISHAVGKAVETLECNTNPKTLKAFSFNLSAVSQMATHHMT
jgi:hypothetical protein